MFKIGVMGCGAVSTYGHLPAIVNTPGLEVSALYDPDPARVNELGAHYPLAWRFTDSAAFFTAPLDAVVIASPAPTHLANLELCARHNKHVLCEKPLGHSEDEAQRMITIMQERELMLFVGFCYRYSPVAMRIRSLIMDGAIGTPRSLRLIYLWNLDGKMLHTSDGGTVPNIRRDERMHEGGPMVDCGVHMIDLARWWLQSEPVEYSGVGAWAEEYKAPDHVWLYLKHGNGAVSHVETSFSYTATARDSAAIFTYEIIGTGGLIRYDRDGWRLEMRNAVGTYHYQGASEKNFYGMYSEFESALRTGHRGDLADGSDGLIATRIAVAATEQAISGRVVSISEQTLQKSI